MNENRAAMPTLEQLIGLALEAGREADDHDKRGRQVGTLTGGSINRTLAEQAKQRQALLLIGVSLIAGVNGVRAKLGEIEQRLEQLDAWTQHSVVNDGKVLARLDKLTHAVDNLAVAWVGGPVPEPEPPPPPTRKGKR